VRARGGCAEALRRDAASERRVVYRHGRCVREGGGRDWAREGAVRSDASEERGVMDCDDQWFAGEWVV